MTKKTANLRKEGRAKLTGRALYIDDMHLPDMLHGATIRSPIQRGLLKNMQFQGDLPWHEFTIVTALDIPGQNFISMIENDWPALVEKKINHHGEPIALIAHRDKYLLARALKFIHLEIQVLNPVKDLDESLKKKEILYGDDNIFKSYLINKGDIDQVWQQADYIIEETYNTGAQEQLYIEPNGMIAKYSEDRGITVWGSMQCPYYIHRALMPLFNLPAEKVRIIQTETGGGFGGKEEFPSILAAHAALLAMKSGRPVKMIYSRAEDMANTTKRHPSQTHHKTAVNKEGKILALDIDFVLDAGAYATLSSVVLSRAALHAAGPYACDNIRIKARALASNNNPYGAFRGFGAPQSIFALERHLNKIAKAIGKTPTEIRRLNFIKKGDSTATNQIIHEDIDFNHLLDLAMEKSHYKKKLLEFKEYNKSGFIKKGLGIATFMHGAGFTGAGEKYLASVTTVQGTPAGTIEVLASSTEIGQGKNTIFSKIVSDALNISEDFVCIVNPDTHLVPDSGPTVASRTTMVVGKLLQSAATALKETLIAGQKLKPKYTGQEFSQAIKNYIHEFGALKSTTQYKQPNNITWDEKNYQGDAYVTFAWAAYIAEVSVNTLTYATKVDRFTAVQEVGHVINKTLAEGQIEGGIAQGIGYALYEKVLYKDGAMINNQMTNYIMPTAQDLPQMAVHFAEDHKDYGPNGAKGIGELPIDGPAPAILNAIENASGMAMNFIPMLPEDLMVAMEEQERNAKS